MEVILRILAILTRKFSDTAHKLDTLRHLTTRTDHSFSEVIALASACAYKVTIYIQNPNIERLLNGYFKVVIKIT
jgi:hypothetical protein